MTHKIFITIIYIFFINEVISQNIEDTVKTDSVSWEIRKQSFIYVQAKKFNDPMIAKMALYNLIAVNPVNHILYDSLAVIYFEMGKYISAALVGDRSLALNKNNIRTMRIVAESYAKIGLREKALSHYETLYLKKNELSILYRMTFLQMDLERYKEAETSAQIIIDNPKSKEEFVYFNASKNKNQKVDLQIATHRILAIIEEMKGNTEEAKKLYLKVLEMSPGLEIVQLELKRISTKAKK